MNLAPRGPRRSSSASSSRPHAVVVHRHAADVRLVCREGLQGTDVGRSLGDDHVARVEKGLASRSSALLRTGGDDDVVGESRTPISAISSTIDRAHLGPALARAVLQRAGALVHDRVVGGGSGRPRPARARPRACPPKRDHVGTEAAANRSRTALERTLPCAGRSGRPTGRTPLWRYPSPSRRTSRRKHKSPSLIGRGASSRYHLSSPAVAPIARAAGLVSAGIPVRLRPASGQPFGPGGGHRRGGRADGALFPHVLGAAIRPGCAPRLPARIPPRLREGQSTGPCVPTKRVALTRA
jgi:hypothetical protein